MKGILEYRGPLEDLGFSFGNVYSPFVYVELPEKWEYAHCANKMDYTFRSPNGVERGKMIFSASFNEVRTCLFPRYEPRVELITLKRSSGVDLKPGLVFKPRILDRLCPKRVDLNACLDMASISAINAGASDDLSGIKEQRERLARLVQDVILQHFPYGLNPLAYWEDTRKR